MGEGNFPHGAMLGSVGLLATMAELTPIRCAELLRRRDASATSSRSSRLQHAVRAAQADIWAVGSSAPHMDGAYDKMLTKLGMLPDFPLRLLSPYTELHR